MSNKQAIKEQLDNFIQSLIADGMTEEEAIVATRWVVKKLRSKLISDTADDSMKTKSVTK